MDETQVIKPKPGMAFRYVGEQHKSRLGHYIHYFVGLDPTSNNASWVFVSQNGGRTHSVLSWEGLPKDYVRWPEHDRIVTTEGGFDYLEYINQSAQIRNLKHNEDLKKRVKDLELSNTLLIDSLSYKQLELDALQKQIELADASIYRLCSQRAAAECIGKFKIGQKVRKIKGSQWEGTVCGYYKTALTPIGYAVESDTEIGSVQIYPEAALEAVEGE